MIDRRRLKDLIEIVQSAVNILAIIVAGSWAYMLFIQHREIMPKVKIDLHIVYRDIIDDKTWLRSEVFLENVGNTMLRVREIEARIQLVEPLDDVIVRRLQAGEHIVDPAYNVVMWPEMGKRNMTINLHLEPGEKDIIPFEFFLPSEWRTIKIYVFMYNELSTNLGWSSTAIYSRESCQ